MVHLIYMSFRPSMLIFLFKVKTLQARSDSAWLTLFCFIKAQSKTEIPQIGPSV